MFCGLTETGARLTEWRVIQDWIKCRKWPASPTARYRTLNGDRIADPNGRIGGSGGSVKAFTNRPLFSSAGPRFDDIRQGACGDCYFLAGISAIAQDSPNTLRQNIVDFNDGTYGVRMGDRFYRVDNDLPVDSSNSSSPSYAQLGREGSMWVAIAEGICSLSHWCQQLRFD